MSSENLGFLPETVVGGETIWIAAANTALDDPEDIIFDDFTPAGGYTLAYQFAAPTPLSVAAAANGANTGWTLTITGAQTLVWGAGRIAFVGMVTHTASQRTYAPDQGVISVSASPMRVSQWAAVLTSIDAAIASYAANPYGTVNVDGFNVSFRSLEELINLRDYVNYLMASDNAKKQKRIIRARFECQQ